MGTPFLGIFFDMAFNISATGRVCHSPMAGITAITGCVNIGLLFLGCCSCSEDNRDPILSSSKNSDEGLRDNLQRNSGPSGPGEGSTKSLSHTSVSSQDREGYKHIQSNSHNVTPALMKVAAMVKNNFAIQDPETVLGVRYCCKFFPLPNKNQKQEYRLVCFQLSGLGRLRSGS